MKLLALFALNILFVVALWHMDVNHELDLQGKEKTRGIFHIAPYRAYRYSEYALMLVLFLIDLVVVFYT